MIEIGIFVCVLGVGFVVGRYNEKAHYKRIIAREEELNMIPTSTFDKAAGIQNVREIAIFTGSVVISSDRFKSLVAGIANIFGGNIVVYESLLDRARREALIRTKQQALEWGCDEILNVRYETSTIGGKARKTIACVEVLAYGTAIKY